VDDDHDSWESGVAVQAEGAGRTERKEVYEGRKCMKGGSAGRKEVYKGSSVRRKTTGERRKCVKEGSL
jgi:hypothetical protein